jgi:hypothetical protein
VESSDEFDTNLELLKISYKVNFKDDQRYNNLFMQPIESIETISYSSNSNSKNTRRKTKGLTRGFAC